MSSMFSPKQAEPILGDGMCSTAADSDSDQIQIRFIVIATTKQTKIVLFIAKVSLWWGNVHSQSKTATLITHSHKRACLCECGISVAVLDWE